MPMHFVALPFELVRQAFHVGETAGKGQPLLCRLVGGQLLGLLIGRHLQAVFDIAQKNIGLRQLLSGPGVHTTRGHHARQHR